MAKKGFIPEQIINKLREAELLLNQGATIRVGVVPGSAYGAPGKGYVLLSFANSLMSIKRALRRIAAIV